MSVPCDVLSLAVPGVRTLAPYQPGKPESELRREFGLQHIVKLASNENPLGPGEAALTAARACLSELHRYPDGNGFALKAALAERFGLLPDAITLGSGSNDVLELVARAFLGPGRTAVFSAHAFAVYPIATQASGATARVAPALPADHPQMPYGHDLDALLAQIAPDTRVLFVANPNNPTGTWADRASLRRFLERVPPQVIVVVDEAYCEYAEPAADLPNAIEWLGDFENLVVTRTFSKAYGLAGLRVGYAVSHPTVADLLNRVRMPFNVNAPALAAATAALGDLAHLERSCAVNQSGLQQLRAGLQALGLSALPTVGNFLCVDLHGRSTGREVFQKLLPKGVIVRPVDNYGLPGFVRVTVGLESENALFLQALGEVLGG